MSRQRRASACAATSRSSWSASLVGGHAHGRHAAGARHRRLQVGAHALRVLARHDQHHGARGARRPGPTSGARADTAARLARCRSAPSIVAAATTTGPSRLALWRRTRSRSRSRASGPASSRSTSSWPPSRSSASATVRAKSSTSAVTRAPRSSVRRPARSSGASRRSTSVATCSVPARAAATSPDSTTTQRPEATAARHRVGPAPGRCPRRPGARRRGVHTETAPSSTLESTSATSATPPPPSSRSVSRSCARAAASTASVCWVSERLASSSSAKSRAFSSATTACAANEVSRLTSDCGKRRTDRCTASSAPITRPSSTSGTPRIARICSPATASSM